MLPVFDSKSRYRRNTFSVGDYYHLPVPVMFKNPELGNLKKIDVVSANILLHTSLENVNIALLF
jgi:hypothetical protein